MRTGNLIVFSPGFRYVWKFKIDAVPLVILIITFTLAVIVMGTVGYVAPLLANNDNEHSSRLVVENGNLSIQNRAAQRELEKLAERARQLEEESSRIAAELHE